MYRRDAIKKISLLFGTLSVSPELIAKALDNKTSILQTVPADRLSLLGEVMDIIIPDTDTPGAKSAKAHEFLAVVIADCISPEEGRVFWDGLDKFENDCKSSTGKSFLECSLPEKNSFFKSVEENAVRTGDFFYFNIKNLTLQAYFTTEAGATQALNYDPIPGPWIADMPLPEDRKAWAVVY